MQRHHMQIGSLALATSLLSFGLSWAMEHLTAPVNIVGSFVRLRLSHNPGIAFSVLLPPVLQEVLIGAALIGVVVLALRSKHTSLCILGFGLIIGGAIGNLLDRVGDGLVTDYLAIGTFPIFNLADTCISIGVGLLLWNAWEESSQKK